MDKKAQGISINTIIIAAIALIVLVVLIAIFTGRLGGFGQGVDIATKGTACDTGGGERLPVSTGCGDLGPAVGIFSDTGGNTGFICCKKS